MQNENNYSVDNNPIQNQLDIMMEILEDNKDKLSDGIYLRGMNALGSLHKHKLNAFTPVNSHNLVNEWMTHDDIYEYEEMYDEVMELADAIVTELCGDESSIYSDDTNYNLVYRGEENVIFNLLINYRPVEGNAGYNSHPMVLHHAIQIIMMRLFKDTKRQLQIVTPCNCKCGWRGTNGNWERHINNARHQKWLHREKESNPVKSSDNDCCLQHNASNKCL